MARNKMIWSCVLMFQCIALCSCVQKIEYHYEDVIISRYDYEGFLNGRLRYKSVYYCNKSDKKCRIEITGIQNHYRAKLCIDRNTLKVWIHDSDCYMQQQVVDTMHFQAALNHGIYKELNVNYNTLRADKIPELLESKYECYSLLGLGDYVKYEEEDSKKEFPNSKIEARYY